MKKFTITLIAALVAVISWAQPTAMKNRRQLPEQFAVKSVSDFKLAPEKKQMAPRPALKAKVQAPVQNTGMRKAPAKVKKIADLSALTTTYIAKNFMYTVENVGTEEEPSYQPVPANIARTAEVWEITLINEESNTVGITGIGGYDETVNATVDLESSTITIPYGQAIGTTNYGTIGIASATGAAEALVGTITEEGISFQDLWEIDLIDGDYAGYAWSDIYYTEAVLPNGKMTWSTSKGDVEADVAIDFDEVNFVATVWNFGNYGIAVDVILKNGGKFVIEPQLVEEDDGTGTYGDFLTSGIDITDDCVNIAGTGTENTLTFASEWTCYAPSTGYWYGKQGAATITFDGTFTYPVLAEAAATPADPSVVFFDFESATVTLTVPAVDVDGNDIISSLLTYQLFTQDAVGNPVALGEPIAYDNEENGVADQKTVVLGEEAKGLTVIGVKSIYAAGGETNESQIAWFAIPQLVEVPEGLEVKEYPVTADAYSGSWTDYTGAALVGVDGTDVYVQGILPHCPNGWAKGTIEDGVVTFPIQVVGSYNGSVYIHLAGYDTETKGLKPVTFTYNADEDIYMSEDVIFANSSADKLGFYYPYFDGMTIGEETIPELVELPEGAEVVEYPFVGTTFSSSGSAEFESTVNVAVVENDVYVQGLNEYVPEAWVKGTKDEETGNIVFATGQNLGTFEYNGSTYQFYMVGYDSEAEAITDVVMTYNEKQDFYELQNDLLVNGKKNSISYYKWYEAGSTIGIQTEFEATFDFNAMDVATSSSVTTDGDITEALTLTEENIVLTISPKVSGTENRFWSTTAGPQLRVYSGTLTFEAPEKAKITQIVFNTSRWNGGNSADTGEFDGATWTGEAQTVVVTIAGNSQINSIVVTMKKESGPVVVELPEGVEAEEYTMFYEDEDGNSAAKTVSLAVDGSDVYVQGFSEYIPEAWVKGTKDESNTVTFPAMQYLGKYSGLASYAFYESDAVFTYDAEADTYTAEGEIFGLLGDYYYDGRYFNPVIKKVIDKAAMPADPVITDMENGTYGWYIDFNVPAVDVNGEDLAIGKLSYMIYTDTQGEVAPLTFTSETHTKLTEDMTEIPYGFTENYDFSTNKIYLNDLYSADWTRIGIQSIYRGGGEENVTEIQWFDILPEPEAIEAPEGLETETYLFTANEVENGVEEARRAVTNTDVTFDFNAMDVATSNSSTEGDITEDLVLTEGDVTLTVSPKTTGSTENRFWYVNNVGPQLRVYSGTLTFEVPEGSTMTQIVFNHNGKWGANTVGEDAIANDADAKVATWTGDAQQVVVTIAANSQIDNIVVTVKSESGDEPVEEEYNYSYQMQVGFEGQDVYFKGISEDTADMWLKGTLSEDGKTVTIPANQYLGEISFWGYSFPYFFTAVAEDGETMEDIVLNYDAENNKFATDQVLVLHDGKRKLGEPYQTFYDVVITKMEEFAATPADPIFEDYDFEKGAGYNNIYASIPTVDVDGNALLTSKLFYTIWYEKEGVEQPYTFTAALYSNDFDEDLTEIPYSYDGYDFYKGGEIIYLEDDPAELATWTKVGIQSIYYGGGECNKSNIVWSDPITTGIANVNVDSKNAVIFDLQGRRVAKATKGLYIVDGKKVVMK